MYPHVCLVLHGHFYGSKSFDLYYILRHATLIELPSAFFYNVVRASKLPDCMECACPKDTNHYKVKTP